MMKLGQTKVPLDKIPLLEKACSVDWAYLMRLAIQEHMPTSWEAISGSLGDILSDNETKAVQFIRDVFSEDDLDMGTVGKLKFRDCVEALKTS